MSDVFRDDPLATRYVIAELSGVLGNQDVDPDKVAGVIGGGVPEGMSRTEYDQRIKLLGRITHREKRGQHETEGLYRRGQDRADRASQGDRGAHRVQTGAGGAERPYRPGSAGQAAHAVPEEARSLVSIRPFADWPPCRSRSHRRRDRDESRRRRKADAPTPESQAPIPTQAHVAVTTQAPAGDPHTNGQPAAGTNGPGATVESPTRTELVPERTDRARRWSCRTGRRWSLERTDRARPRNRRGERKWSLERTDRARPRNRRGERKWSLERTDRARPRNRRGERKVLLERTDPARPRHRRGERKVSLERTDRARSRHRRGERKVSLERTDRARRGTAAANGRCLWNERTGRGHHGRSCESGCHEIATACGVVGWVTAKSLTVTDSAEWPLGEPSSRGALPHVESSPT